MRLSIQMFLRNIVLRTQRSNFNFEQEVAGGSTKHFTSQLLNVLFFSDQKEHTGFIIVTGFFFLPQGFKNNDNNIRYFQTQRAQCLAAITMSSPSSRLFAYLNSVVVFIHVQKLRCGAQMAA